MKKVYKGDHKKGEIEIVETQLIFKNQFIEVENDIVVFPKGNTGTYLRVRSENEKSVAVLPFTDDGKIILITTFRHGARGWGLEVPKGAVEKGENEEAAAKRELIEETGFTCDKLTLIDDYADSPAVFSSAMRCFYAFSCKNVKEIECENTEAIREVKCLTPKEYFEESAKMDFKDAFTEMLIYRYMSERDKKNG